MQGVRGGHQIQQCLQFDDVGVKPVRASGSRWVTHKLKRVLSKFGAYTGHLIALSEERSVKAVDRAKLKGYCSKWIHAKYILGCAFCGMKKWCSYQTVVFPFLILSTQPSFCETSLGRWRTRPGVKRYKCNDRGKNREPFSLSTATNPGPEQVAQGLQ